MKKLVVMLLLFFSAVGAQSADNQRDLSSQETFKILGIELGKDTINDLKKISKEKNCQLEKNEGDSYSMKGCFDLPGNYWIKYSFDQKTGKIFSILFRLDYDAFDSGPDSTMQRYLEALKKRYGEPSSVDYFKTFSTWVWAFPNLTIEAIDRFGFQPLHHFDIEYVSPIVTKMMEEREVNKISSQM